MYKLHHMEVKGKLSLSVLKNGKTWEGRQPDSSIFTWNLDPQHLPPTPATLEPLRSNSRAVLGLP